MFTGRELDAETGLFYYRARYFSADLGRFLSRDPLGFSAGDFNLYRYCENNPVVFVDPLGLRGRLNGRWNETHQERDHAGAFTVTFTGRLRADLSNIYSLSSFGGTEADIRIIARLWCNGKGRIEIPNGYLRIEGAPDDWFEGFTLGAGPFGAKQDSVFDVNATLETGDLESGGQYAIIRDIIVTWDVVETLELKFGKRKIGSKTGLYRKSTQVAYIRLNDMLVFRCCPQSDSQGGGDTDPGPQFDINGDLLPPQRPHFDYHEFFYPSPPLCEG